MGGDELEQGSLREAASYFGATDGRHGKHHRVHIGTAVMPDYLNEHYNPYSSVLNRGERKQKKLIMSFGTALRMSGYRYERGSCFIRVVVRAVVDHPVPGLGLTSSMCSTYTERDRNLQYTHIVTVLKIQSVRCRV